MRPWPVRALISASFLSEKINRGTSPISMSKHILGVVVFRALPHILINPFILKLMSDSASDRVVALLQMHRGALGTIHPFESENLVFPLFCHIRLRLRHTTPRTCARTCLPSIDLYSWPKQHQNESIENKHRPTGRTNKIVVPLVKLENIFISKSRAHHS